MEGNRVDSVMLGGKSIILRLEMNTELVKFARIAACISDEGGDLVAIDVIQTSGKVTVRDLTVAMAEVGQAENIIRSIRQLQGVRVINVSDRTFLMHLGGKIETKLKVPIQNRDDLSRVYTPEVARVCRAIQEDPNKAYSLTIKRNTVAVVSDGSAVLGLGNIGPGAAMPVMEGKAMLFKQLADVDAFPICLDTQDTGEIVRNIKLIAPAFGGINLEDIASPRCFEIKTLEQAKIVVCGVGAAGVACCKMLLSAGAKNVVAVDRYGALVPGRTYANPMWQWVAGHTNPHGEEGNLAEIVRGADVFIGLSAGGILRREHVLTMADQPIIFAMANPVPEIDPHEVEDIAAVVATGRSDHPNQINNVLCFPGIFRGALDCRASDINEEMKMAAAKAIASCISDEERSQHYIIPGVFNDMVVKRVRASVIEAAIRTGVARRIPPDFRRRTET